MKDSSIRMVKNAAVLVMQWPSLSFFIIASSDSIFTGAPSTRSISMELWSCYSWCWSLNWYPPKLEIDCSKSFEGSRVPNYLSNPWLHCLHHASWLFREVLISLRPCVSSTTSSSCKSAFCWNTCRIHPISSQKAYIWSSISLPLSSYKTTFSVCLHLLNSSLSFFW